MKNPIIIIFTLLLCSCYSLKAQLLETFNSVNSAGYKYWFYSPEISEADSIKKPLIIYLHGRSCCGYDLNNVLRYGTLDALRRGRTIDAFVAAPQNPGGSWSPTKVIDIVDWAIENYPVDSCRVYVIGMSLGGFGTISAASAYPNRFAAAMALCGGGVKPDYNALNSIPLWIMHGTADRSVAVNQSDAIVNGMKSLGEPERLIYDRFTGYNHSILARVFYLPQTYDWLFAHSLADSARTVCREYKITKADIDGAYNNLSRPEKSKIKMSTHLLTESKAKTTPAEDTKQPTYYKVRKGDTLYSIAKKYKTTVNKLCQLNGIKPSTKLSIGKNLKVK